MGWKKHRTDVWQMRSYRHGRWKKQKLKACKAKSLVTSAALSLQHLLAYIYTTVQQPMKTHFGTIRGTVLHVKRIVHKNNHHSLILVPFKTHMTFLSCRTKGVVHDGMCLICPYISILFTMFFISNHMEYLLVCKEAVRRKKESHMDL